MSPTATVAYFINECKHIYQTPHFALCVMSLFQSPRKWIVSFPWKVDILYRSWRLTWTYRKYAYDRIQGFYFLKRQRYWTSTTPSKTASCIPPDSEHKGNGTLSPYANDRQVVLDFHPPRPKCYEVGERTHVPKSLERPWFRTKDSVNTKFSYLVMHIHF